MKNMEIAKIELKGFQDLCRRLGELEQENDFLQKQNNALKIRCSELSQRNLELESEIADLRFTRKYLTSEEAGRKFAEELLGGV